MKYNKIKKKITKYLENQNKIKDDNIISGYELAVIISKILSELGDIMTGKNLKSIIKSDVKTINYKCDINQEKSSIEFVPEILSSNFYQVITINKDFNDNELYLSNKFYGEKEREFIRDSKLIELIIQNLNILEKYAKLFQSNILCNNKTFDNDILLTQKISDGFLDIIFTIPNHITQSTQYSLDNIIKNLITININPKVDIAEYAKREWINEERPKIDDIIENNKKQILNNIQISKKNLNKVFKKLINTNKSKVKTKAR